jgi:nicotinamide-nucleotide adenylyltransferase
LADLNRHAQWVAYVDSQVPAYEAVVTNNPLTGLLFGQAGYKVIEDGLIQRDVYSGTRIRIRLAAGQDVSDAVPPTVAKTLAKLDVRARLRAVRPEALDG